MGLFPHSIFFGGVWFAACRVCLDAKPFCPVCQGALTSVQELTGKGRGSDLNREFFSCLGLDRENGNEEGMG